MTTISSNLLTALGAGSGVDTKNLVTELVNAEKTPRQAALDERTEKVEARISALATFRSAIDALTSALATRISSGALSGMAGVSDPSVLGFTLPNGGTVPRQTLEVRQLASGQSLASAPVADASDPVGEGTFTIRFGRVSGTEAATGFEAGVLDDLNIVIDAENNSLTGLRNAINDAASLANAPVQAVIITDSTGSRLLLRGQMGEESAFIVESDIEAFAFREDGTGGLTRTQVAQDSRVAIDGVEIRRPSNTITDLVDNARIALYKAAPGSLITIEAARDTSQLTQIVDDVASALNELVGVGKSLSTAATSTSSAGALVADSATRRTLLELKQLSTKDLLGSTDGSPTRLSDIGLSIDRYGKFVVDSARLERAAENYPEAVEAMMRALNASKSGTTPAGPLKQIADNFAIAVDGSSGETTALSKEKARIAEDQQKLDDRMERLTTQYTKRFASVDSIVNKYNSLMTFMQQQVDLWTKSKN